MHLYETTFIVNPESDDAVIDEQVKAVSQLISNNGGKIVREERMGTRRLAYPIKNHFQGYYATFLFEAEPPVLRALDRHMKLGEAYIRHMTIRFEAEPDEVFKEKPDFVPGHGAGVNNKDSRRQKVSQAKPEQKEPVAPVEKKIVPDTTPKAETETGIGDKDSVESDTEQEEL